MRSYRLMFASGLDSVGLVHSLSRFVYEHHCNVADSRMAVLGGQFSAMMLIGGSEADVSRLEHDLSAFQVETGLAAMIADAAQPGAGREAPALPVRLEVVAMDAPGILVQLSERLDQLGVNIDALDARLTEAPSSSTTISSVKLRLSVPKHIPLQQVKDELNKLAVRINLDIAFHPFQE
ncbi:MAG: hypothetical protein JRF33_19875 [Deltaproteobacteria bacterium]|nr:hypothetical protein [Deltaproteobacteria bacterium]